MAAATSPATLARRQANARDLVALFSLAVLSLSGLLAVLPPRHAEALPVLLLIALTGWAGYRHARLALAWPLLVLFAVPVALPWTGGDQSPLLPTLLCAGLTLGLLHERPGLGAACAAAFGVLVLAAVVRDGGFGLSDRGLLIAGAQWLSLAFAVGLVIRWARRVAAGPPPADPYEQTRDLLEQLRHHSQHLPGSLDAAGTADALLERCSQICANDRSAVVVSFAPGSTTPLAVRGTGRVPWRADLEEITPLRQAWLTGVPQQDVRRTDIDGRRRGSALLAVPLPFSDGARGVIVLEAFGQKDFAPEVVAAVQQLAEQTAMQLESALLLEEVRLATSAGERDRLAREMHDGIAQELAYFGYRLDDLKARAINPEVAVLAGELRTDLTKLIGDLRLSITTMRTTVRPDLGLGQALSGYLQAVCSGKPIELRLFLKECPYRLSADHEVALLHAAQAFGAQVRRSGTVRELDVSLIVDSPSARLRMACDVPIRLPGSLGVFDTLRQLGAIVSEGDTSGAVPDGSGVLDIRLGGEPHDDPRPARG